MTDRETINHIIKKFPSWKKRYVRIINYYIYDEQSYLIIKNKSKLEIKEELSAKWNSYFKDLILAKSKKEFDEKHRAFKSERRNRDLARISIAVPLFVIPFIGVSGAGWAGLAVGALATGFTINSIRLRSKEKTVDKILYEKS